VILDRVENAARYRGLGERFAFALESLTGEIAGRPPGRYELLGEEVFALVQEYETKPREEAVWEAHRRYADVQLVIAGSEVFGCAPANALRESKPYDPEKDFVLYEGEGNLVTVPAGWFALFFPGEEHMPQVQAGGPGKVRKLVVKVAVD
jgi:biofilm protein TabA